MSQRKANKNHPKRASGHTNVASKSTDLQTLNEMFPDWETDDLATLLIEHNNDVEFVIDSIVNNKVAKWEPIKKDTKPKKREESHDSVTPTTSSQNHDQGFKSQKKDKVKVDKRRDKKAAHTPRKDSASSSSASKSLSIESGKLSTSRSNNTEGAQKIQSNSWAATLGKESKAKSGTTPSSVTEAIGETESQERKYTSKRESDFQADSKRHTDSGSNEEHTKEQTPTSSTSWASAIKPKSKPQPRKDVSYETSAPKSVSDQKSNVLPIKAQVPDSSKSDETTLEPITKPNVSDYHTKDSTTTVKESEVILPQEVSNIGVSFGSLTLGSKDANVEREENTALNSLASESIKPQQAVDEQMYHDPQDSVRGSETINQYTQIQNQHAQQVQQSKPTQSVDQISQAQQSQGQHEQHHSGQGQQNYPQQQHHQQQKNAPQGQEFQSQYQQMQQQYPQQAAAGNIPGQFAYPGYDYSAAFAQAGVGSISPAYYHNTMNASVHGKSGSHGGSNADFGSSPLIQGSTIAQQNLSQQAQQIPGSAPFGFPNYYNYYYNTPFYGNGANIGATGGGYGMQPHMSDNSGGNNTSAGDGEAPSQDSQNAQSVNQYYGQYYAAPNQFNARGGYPFTGYPATQPFPSSSVQFGGSNDKQEQAGQQQQNQQGQQQHQQQQNQQQQVSTEKKKSSRKKKDPNAPKRSLSAYMFFANENRDIVRAENPGITFGQVGKMLGDKWKAMSPTDKEPYESKAAADKKRYEKEKAEYAKRQ
ncbi:hypothetical protein CJI82_04093 [Candidozyma auris]